MHFDAQARIAMLQARIQQAEAAIVRHSYRKLKALEDLRDAEDGISDAQQELSRTLSAIDQIIGGGK